MLRSRLFGVVRMSNTFLFEIARLRGCGHAGQVKSTGKTCSVETVHCIPPVDLTPGAFNTCSSRPVAGPAQ